MNGIVRQFNGYTVLDSLHINGKATAGENIADLGGIVIGLRCLQEDRAVQEGRENRGPHADAALLPGLRPGLAGAPARRSAWPSAILTDVHSPAQYRVNGPFADVPAFYEAFDVQPTDKLYRPDSARVKIW